MRRGEFWLGRLLGILVGRLLGSLGEVLAGVRPEVLLAVLLLAAGVHHVDLWRGVGVGGLDIGVRLLGGCGHVVDVLGVEVGGDHPGGLPIEG